MADYNLAGLSTRSFEQLVQAIAAKVIGPGIVIFGDGRDGGREATFEGSTTHAPGGQHWDGYVIVQAKFKQRPQDTQTDGDWAIRQLRVELEDFTNPQKARRKPEYYIFATNVILTPFPEKGAKDKAYAVFKEYEDRVPIKEFDIWDYDKIRAFLDGNEDIRRAYSAWITPGDVLSQVIDWLKPDRPDFEVTLSRYLQEELMADQYANLEQAGHASDTRIPLARVFVDLPTFDRYLVEPPEEGNGAEELEFPHIFPREHVSPGFIREVLSTAAERLDPQSCITRSSVSNITGATEFEAGRFALIGGPGQGKTTIGQYICQLFRTAILREKPEWFLDPEVRKALGLIETQCKEDGFELPTARRFPIRIVLSKFARSLASKEGNINSVLSYIVDRIRRKTDQEVSLEDFRQWLKIYPWILILDGLDEVPASSNRDEVLAALRSFRMEARNSNADILIITTTRPQGYSQEFSPGHFKHKYLAPLSPARAMNYGKRLVNVRHSGDQERKEKILTRLERASQQAATARLMRSPLQVTIMATLVDRMGQPPQERWNLFREYYNVIYQREVERDIPAAAILREYKMDVDTIHKYVGLLLQVKSERTGRTDARLSSEDFAGVVEARLDDMGHQGEERANLKRDIIQAATDRLVFLVGLEADEVGFEIRSLQEYMAAEGLMAGSDIDVRNRLREIAPNANWRNVFLFAAGKCAAEREDLLDTIYAICLKLNDDPDDEVARVTLAGSQLALDLLEDTPIKQQPKNARSLVRIAIRLLDSPPSSHQVRLGDLYNSALESIYREELTSRLRHVDFYRRLGALTCLIRLLEINVSWANELKDEQWPADLTKQHAALKVTNLAGGKEWLQSKVVDIVPRLSPTEVYQLFNDEGSLSFRREDGSTPAWGSALGVILDEDPFPTGTINLSIFSSQQQSSALQPFILSATEDSNWLIPLQNMPDPSPAWVPFVAAARFLTSPSKETLARELRIIANKYDFEAIDWATSMLPWPIGACLAESRNQADLLRLADRITAGELGDADAWFDAEERWVSEGIVAEDMEYATDDKWPFDSNIALRGYPFAAGSWSYSGRGAAQLLRRLLEVHSKLEKSRMRTEIAKWILILLGMADNPHYDVKLSVKPSVQVLERFSKFVEDILPSRHIFNLDSFGSIGHEDALTEEWIIFFDQLGRWPHISKSTHSGKILQGSNEELLFKRLSEAYSSDSNRVGILRLLSFFAIKGLELPQPLNLIDPKQYSDDLIREAAVTVRLVQGNWDDEEAKELANCINELLNKRVRFISTLKRLIERLPHSLDLTKILLELNQLLPSSRWELSERIIGSLNDSLRRRTSQLGTPDVWNGLHLPAGLSSLLRE